MLLLNPMDALPDKLVTGARALLLRGGRVVLVMEHCKNGCYGNAAGDNAFLEALGSSLRLSGEGGAPLSETPRRPADPGPAGRPLRRGRDGAARPGCNYRQDLAP